MNFFFIFKKIGLIILFKESFCAKRFLSSSKWSDNVSTLNSVHEYNIDAQRINDI